MLRKILKGLAAVLATLVVLALVTYIATGPEQLPSNAASAEWLEPGPYSVGQMQFTFVDNSRPTNENRGVPGKPERSFPTTLWYPEGLDGPHPLIIHSHGILSNGVEMPYVSEQLASYGYVVAAADYPLTSGATEGGANAADVVNQPADVTFLIDSVLGLSGGEKPFVGEIDLERIGLSGYSLGGLTTYLATYHPRMREPRVSAALAIAGPSAPFSPQFFSTTDVPFLAISGTADALIEHARNASNIPARVANAALVTIDGGSHLGFIGAAEPTFRFMDNPDTLGCAAVLGALGENPNDVFSDLGNVSEGVDMNRDLPGICDSDSYASAAHPGRQHMITQIAVLSFFQSVFAEDIGVRAAAQQQLSQSLSSDFTEASYSE